MGLKEKMAGAVDEAMGLAKRAAGELGARPDMVIAGEAQQARGTREGTNPQSGGHVIGWKLDRGQRQALIARFPPRYPFTVADHVTLSANVAPGAALPPACEARIVGHVDDGRGLEAMVVAIDGGTDRLDGSTYHITWSLGPGRRAKQSDKVIAGIGWRRLPEPVSITLLPAVF